MRPTSRTRRVLLYGLIGAVMGAIAFTVLQALMSTKALSLVNGLALGVIAGFVIGILPAAERDDAEQDRRMERERLGRSGPADATFEGQQARDLDLPHERRHGVHH